MRIERAKNASRNMLFGVLLKVYQILIPFFMRTAMIYFMGVEYLGLNSLFTSVLQVLNLAELGVGSAMVFSMYKPIAEDDKVTICALMRLYRNYYHIIGIVIATVGIILTPFIPKLISGEIPAGINVFVLYLLNLGATVLSYWLFAYKNSLFQAHQRVDMTSKITIVTTTIQYALQLATLIFLKNYYVYVIILLITQAMTNIITAIYADRMYPNYRPEGNLNNDEIQKINQRIKDLFTAKLGAVVVNSADTVVISAFLGLTVLAVYQNYYFILTAITGVVAIVFTSSIAGIGNSLIVESKEKNYNDLNKFTFLISWISGFCACCLLNLYQPFIELWVGKELMLGMPAVVCLSIYFYIFEINQLLNSYKDAGGIWHKDRFRPLVTAITNLTLNLLMVKPLGLYGVLLSTVISMFFVGLPWLFHNLFTTLFAIGQMLNYIKNIMLYIFVAFCNCAVSYLICSNLNYTPILTFFVRLFVCIVVTNVIYYACFKKRGEFKSSLILIDKILGNKFNISKLFK